MKKKINIIINTTIITFIVIFIANSIYTYLHYINNPDIYAARSAPWYLGLQIHGIISLILIFIALIIKYIIKNKIR